MKTIIPFTIIALCFFFVSCTNEDILEVANINESEEFVPVGNPVEVKLTLSSQNFTVDATTRAEDPDTENNAQVPDEVIEEEKNITNFWVFEYDAESEYLIFTPQYLTSDDFTQDESTKEVSATVTLGDNNGNPVIIYVVANVDAGTSSSNAEAWAQKVDKTFEGFKTIEELEHNTLPTTYPTTYVNAGYSFSSTDYWPPSLNNTNDDSFSDYGFPQYQGSLYNHPVPKSGSKKLDAIEENTPISIEVENMYARIMVYLDLTNTSIYQTNAANNRYTKYHLVAQNIPCYCTIGPLADENTTDAYTYPSDMKWGLWGAPDYYYSSSSSTSSTPLTYYSNYGNFLSHIIYIPENIQGENGSSSQKEENAPATATVNKSVTSPDMAHWSTSSGTTYTNYASQTDAFLLQLRYTTISSTGTTADSDHNTSNTRGWFPIFPGGNSTTNFNVRRNCTYIVTYKVAEDE